MSDNSPSGSVTSSDHSAVPVVTESRPTPSLTVRRLRERQSEDPGALAAILAEGCLAYVGFVRDGWPVVLPFLYGVGDFGGGAGPQLLLHGSTGAGLFLDARSGVDVSVCIAHLDGLIYARSMFSAGANYRSAVVFGTARLVPDEHKVRALDLLSDHVMPGRRAEVRPMYEREVAATAILAVSLREASVKLRTGGGQDLSQDGEDPTIWAGVLPLGVRAGDPVASAETAFPAAIPDSVRTLMARLNGPAATTESPTAPR
jgi:nitroimidazol reductase NimA-like FMN-containing flavoprotein (pyridoxamine 5'-phosphate oxidase superfamily)